MLSDQSPTLMTPFNLIYFLRGPVSKYSHLGGFGLQHMNLRGGKRRNSVCNMFSTLPDTWWVPLSEHLLHLNLKGLR